MFRCKKNIPLEFCINATKVSRPQTQSVSIHMRADPGISRMFSPAKVQVKLKIQVRVLGSRSLQAADISISQKWRIRLQ